jgi:hypothetical protein
LAEGRVCPPQKGQEGYMHRQATSEGGGLAEARREFERWRRGRARGARIPARLWQVAVRVAGSHGVSKTSLALGLDYYALQRRLAGAEAKQGRSPGFVELALPATGSGQARCQLEFGGGSGARVRVDVTGLSPGELATFVRAVAGQEERDPCSR